MIMIFLCRLIDGQWCRIERHHTSLGFSTMVEATEFAESLNAREWPKFDWLLGPVEAFLAIRAKGVSSLRG
jgi:hypothetical protein